MAAVAADLRYCQTDHEDRNRDQRMPTDTSQIRIILCDVDGVMTDGGLFVDSAGEVGVRFDIRDGLAIRLWRQTGRLFGVVSGRASPAVRSRAEFLQLDEIHLGQLRKIDVVEEILARRKLPTTALCYLGDDLLDLPALRMAGLGVTVADATREAQAAADLITTARGGHGAVRETIERILSATGEWEQIAARWSA